MFINDLDSGIVSWIPKFADDTKMFSNVINAVQHYQFQKDLNTLSQWSKDLQMLFHVDKCKVMHFG